MTDTAPNRSVDGAAPVPPTGTATDVQHAVRELLSVAGIERNVDQITQIVGTAIRLGQDDGDRLDLKITNAALAEMRTAFKVFAPYQDTFKVTIFGSARTGGDDPLYLQTHRLAEALAALGWMVVTGAGPGIMQAAMEGAGADRSIGVSIRLPFETRANDIIHGDAKHAAMKYFFTRKLMLVKESQGFVCLPGGFGTLDETFELLTLQQTGKAEPTPIVLLDVPGGTYWRGFSRFVADELASRGLVSPTDMSRVLVTDSVDLARDEILQFWRNYDSLRWVGTTLVLRLRAEPTDADIATLNDRFSDLIASGRIERTGPLGPEVSGRDKLDLPRISLVLDQFKVGRLHELIRAVNALPTAPPLPDVAVS